MRTRARLCLVLGLLVAALTASLLPWTHGGTAATRAADGGTRAQDEPAAPHVRTATEAVAQAARAREKVLIEAETTATSRTWALPDGTRESEFGALPQRAKNAKGEWAPLNTRLRHTSKGVEPVNAAFPVRFSAGGDKARTVAVTRAGHDGKERADRSLVRGPLGAAPRATDTVLAEVDLEGDTVTYTWPGKLPEPVLDGPRALYPEVLPGIDLLVVAREEGGFAQLLVVKDEEAARDERLAGLSFGLYSETARFTHNSAKDTVSITDAEGGRVIGTMPTPFAWDSSGRDPEAKPGTEARTATATSEDVLGLSGLSGIEPGARSGVLETTFTEDEAGEGARLGVDVRASGLLEKKDVAYPLFVDPGINPGWAAWTVAYKPYPNTSFYNGTNFNSGTSDARVGYESDTGGTARSFWRINISSKLKGAVVSDAKFKVLNNYSWSCTKKSFLLYRTGAISSGTTWNKQPSWSKHQQTKDFAHGYTGCSDEYVSFTVDEAATYAAGQGSSTLTFGMRADADDEKSAYSWRKFSAKSATLSVTYNHKPGEPTGGKTTPGGACAVTPATRPVGKTTIKLSASAKDADGTVPKLRFRWWKSGASAPTGTLVTANSAGAASLSIPSGSLADKTTYKWDVRAEDSDGALSTYFPPGDQPCQFTVDGSAPPAPEVTSVDWPEATADGLTWSDKHFGETGTITFTSPGATKFSWTTVGADYTEKAATVGKDEDGVETGKLTLSLKPPNAGPNSMRVYAYDAVGNKSTEYTDYAFWVTPGNEADAPGDLSGDAVPDLLTINENGNLRSYPGLEGGELYTGLPAAYTADGKQNPAGHWFDSATGKAALISHHGDAYPGDGVTDLFARATDGRFWLYPGDGYGSFDIDKRLEVLLPSNAPKPSTWTQLKAVGDITGDKRPEVFIRSGASFWALVGYSGGTFKEAVEMNADAWLERDIVNVADIDLDGTPDLLWRNTSNGNMYIRHGKPGAVKGSVSLDSLRVATASREGVDTSYGTSWSGASVKVALGIPDISGDKIPDIWAWFADGSIRVYHPSKTNTNPAVKTVIADWSLIKGIG
ncbi:DNRLRE domain-containing protein [Streptomyces sp. SID11385]|uniref:DNRLRE domain-containing protein n=1 Tax=Streptomyces sp. SID11385 TaxID=2706031 RepID=UPI0031BA8DA5